MDVGEFVCIIVGAFLGSLLAIVVVILVLYRRLKRIVGFFKTDKPRLPTLEDLHGGVLIEEEA